MESEEGSCKPQITCMVRRASHIRHGREEARRTSRCAPTVRLEGKDVGDAAPFLQSGSHVISAMRQGRGMTRGRYTRTGHKTFVAPTCKSPGKDMSLGCWPEELD